MDSFKLYKQLDISALVRERAGEEKLGQHVQVAGSLESIKASTAKFVLLGVPEDIGVRANHGVRGAKTAWLPALIAIVNLQSNPFLKGDEILILGHFEIDDPADQSMAGLRQKTSEIDSLVYPIIQTIVAAGKIPIVIGGGHNNASPIITGAAIALHQQLNVVNIDAHADLRNIGEGRHSGNGFSHAIQQGHLNEYRMFGLHQNYTHQSLPSHLADHTHTKAFYFEDILASDYSFTENWINFTKTLPEPCGLEVDLDSIANLLSSAGSTTGFMLNDIRKLLLLGNKNWCYLHICEGAESLFDGRKDATMGKTIAYLISDFIKALLPRTYRLL